MEQYLTPKGQLQCCSLVGHQHSACRADTRIGSWQSAVGLNIANLKNKKGYALRDVCANSSLAKWDVLFIIFPSQDEMD